MQLEAGQLHLWRIRLNEGPKLEPTAGEEARAAKFATPILRRRYLRSHSALRDILGSLTGARLDFALHEHGKPYLPAVPELRFNLAHSGEMAMVAVALHVDVGVDIERLRPLEDYAAIADRYFPPGYPQPNSPREFFLYWTRLEAILKAQGMGLYGAGALIVGEWIVRQVDTGVRGYVAAIATTAPMPPLQMHDYGVDE